MKLFDFVKRTPVIEKPPAPVAASSVAALTPEAIVDRRWEFQPIMVSEKGNPTYGHDSIMSLCSIHIARSLASLAEDVAAIRKHVTRLQLVRDDDEPDPPGA